MSRWIRYLLAAVVVVLVGIALGRELLSLIREHTRREVTLGSFNVQTLFDGDYDGGEFDEFNPYASSWNDHAYRARLQDLAGVIRSLTPAGPPELLALQELEGADVLADLAAALGEGRYPYRACAPGPAVMPVCIASVYPFVELRTHALRAEAPAAAHAAAGAPVLPAESPPALRSMLEAQVKTPAGRLRVLVGHWKSAREGRDETRYLRGIAALSVRRRIAGLRAEGSAETIVLAGDLNTEITGAGPAPDSRWAKGIVGRQPLGSGDRAILPVRLDRLAPGGGARTGGARPGEDRAGGGAREGGDAGFSLYSPWGRLQGGSYVFRGRALAIDHILVTEGRDGPVFAGARLVRDWADERGAPRPYRSFSRSGVSDHFALVARFRRAEGLPDAGSLQGRGHLP